MDDPRPIIVEFLHAHLRQRDLADDEDIFAAGYVNSMFLMQLVVMVESRLGITVEDEDLDFANFRSIGALAGFVTRKRAVPVGG